MSAISVRTEKIGNIESRYCWKIVFLPIPVHQQLLPQWTSKYCIAKNYNMKVYESLWSKVSLPCHGLLGLSISKGDNSFICHCAASVEAWSRRKKMLQRTSFGGCWRQGWWQPPGNWLGLVSLRSLPMSICLQESFSQQCNSSWWFRIVISGAWEREKRFWTNWQTL